MDDVRQRKVIEIGNTILIKLTLARCNHKQSAIRVLTIKSINSMIKKVFDGLRWKGGKRLSLEQHLCQQFIRLIRRLPQCGIS